jgi:hypothetical protein
MQGHLKINISLFSALCPPQLHKNPKCLKYLKFADLGVEGKGVEEHGADEGDVSSLAAHMFK